MTHTCKLTQSPLRQAVDKLHDGALELPPMDGWMLYSAMQQILANVDLRPSAECTASMYVWRKPVEALTPQDAAVVQRVQGMNPAMQEMLGQFDMNSPELKDQLDSLGTSPDQVSHC